MDSQSDSKAFMLFSVKSIVVHTLTYFVTGLIMSNFFNYGQLFEQDIIKDFMRPIDSPYVFVGPFLQPLRGLLFAIGLWPIRNLILEKKNGWLILWSIMVIFGILSTPAAAPCSIEGILYTKLPIWYHLIGLPEILLQTLIFSWVLVWWDKQEYLKLKISMPQQTSQLVTEIIKAVMTGCFAYIGYAIGGLLSVAVVGFNIDMGAAAADLRTQMMFVVALVVNVITVYFVSKLWSQGKLRIGTLFALFLGIDTTVPWLYQLIFTSPSPWPLALLLGLFPAVIITLSIRLNHKRMIR